MISGNTPHLRGRLRVAAMLGIACMCAFAQMVRADDAVNLEGTWKIHTPQNMFKSESGAIPFTDRGRKQYRENQRYRAKRQYDDYDYAMARCSSPGVPRIMLTPDRFQIFQRPDMIVFAFEWNRLRRLVAMPALSPQRIIDDVDHAQEVGSMLGRSKGHWEGDTLTILTDNFSDRTLIDAVIPHGYDMKVTERLHLKDPDTLENRITIEDPEYFTQAWQTVITYKRQADAAFPEDVCLDRLDAGKPALPVK